MNLQTLTIAIDENLLKQIDDLITSQGNLDRNQIIQEAIAQKISQLDKSKLAEECEKLDQVFEQDLADEGLDQEW